MGAVHRGRRRPVRLVPPCLASSSSRFLASAASGAHVPSRAPASLRRPQRPCSERSSGTIGDFAKRRRHGRPLIPSASPTKRQRRGSDNGGGAAASAEPQAGMLALVANQNDDKIVVLCEGGPPTELTTKVPTPVCVCIVPSKA
jgi:hypothetical protein